MAGVDEVEATGVGPRMEKEDLDCWIFLETRDAVSLIEGSVPDVVPIEGKR